MLRSLWRLLRRRQTEEALEEELRSSIDLLTRERIEGGAEPTEARRQALIELGGVAQVQEEVRASRGLARLETALRELRFAIRNMVRSPGLSLTVIATLGLALGANSAVLSLLDRLVLRPLPVQDPGALVIVDAPPIPARGSVFMVGGSSAAAVQWLSYPLYRTLRDGVRAFAGATAEMKRDATLLVAGEPVPVRALLVSGNYLQVLGVRVALGRAFTAADEARPASTPFLVLTDGFWRRQFGGDPSIVGRIVRLNQFPMTVIGVAAPGFTGTEAGEAPDLIVPARMSDWIARPSGRFPLRYDSPEMNLYKVMARLAPGVTLQRAEQEADSLYRNQVRATLGNDGYWSPATQQRLATQHLTLTPGGYASNDQSALGRGLKTPITLLMGLMALVLLVAAGNVANLFLARGEARRAEMAIRLALGSTRWRALRQYLLEALLLSAAAGVCGLLVAQWTAGVTPALLSVERLPDGVSWAPDGRTIPAIMGLALLTGLGVWAASAVQASRQWNSSSVGETLQDARQPRPSYGRRLLVVAQVAFSFVLLCASTVLSLSLARLMAVEPGFDLDGLYSVTIRPGEARSQEDPGLGLIGQVSEGLGGIPGVAATSATNALPIASEQPGAFVTSDRSERRDIGGNVVDIGPGYFSALGIPLVAGREFTREDAATNGKLAVINESMARQLFAGGSAIGGRVGLDSEPDLLIIGVVRDVRPGARLEVRPSVFRPFTRYARSRPFSFVMRASGRSLLTREAVRTALRRVDPSMAISDFSSMRNQFSRLLYRDRLLALLSSASAVLAATLCGVGVFGLTAFSVRRRTHEIAVRLALGATRHSVERLLIREAAWLAGAGCVVGFVGFAFVSRALSKVLFAVTPGDPASVATATALLSATVLLSAYLPTIRVTRLDPARSLRRE